MRHGIGRAPLGGAGGRVRCAAWALRAAS